MPNHHHDRTKALINYHGTERLTTHAATVCENSLDIPIVLVSGLPGSSAAVLKCSFCCSLNCPVTGPTSPPPDTMVTPRGLPRLPPPSPPQTHSHVWRFCLEILDSNTLNIAAGNDVFCNQGVRGQHLIIMIYFA